jgi:uncharacterized cupin superfamily protein
MATLSIQANQGSAIQLTDFPLAKEQVLEGNPVAKIWVSAQSADLKVTQGIWDCTAGKFTWNFAWDEFIMVLEGEVIIETEGSPRLTLRKGDFAHFPLGLQTKWHVPIYIKKTFVIRTPEPLKL